MQRGHPITRSISWSQDESPTNTSQGRPTRTSDTKPVGKILLREQDSSKEEHRGTSCETDVVNPNLICRCLNSITENISCRTDIENVSQRSDDTDTLVSPRASRRGFRGHLGPFAHWQSIGDATTMNKCLKIFKVTLP